MRMPRVRFTMRRMMFVVAVIGGLLSIAARRERFKALADYHESAHYKHAVACIDYEYDETVYIPTPRSTWHMDLAIKYDRAAARPWLPVDPDPPEPPPPSTAYFRKVLGSRHPKLRYMLGSKEL